METENLAKTVPLSCIDIIRELDNKGELLDRTIKQYVCSISRRDPENIIERTYESIRGHLKHLTDNIITSTHPRYEGLNDKLTQAGN